MGDSRGGDRGCVDCVSVERAEFGASKIIGDSESFLVSGGICSIEGGFPVRRIGGRFLFGRSRSVGSTDSGSGSSGQDPGKLCAIDPHESV
jgi:hypothetical protein